MYGLENPNYFLSDIYHHFFLFSVGSLFLLPYCWSFYIGYGFITISILFKLELQGLVMFFVSVNGMIVLVC